MLVPVAVPTDNPNVRVGNNEGTLLPLPPLVGNDDDDGGTPAPLVLPLVGNDDGEVTFPLLIVGALLPSANIDGAFAI